MKHLKTIQAYCEAINIASPRYPQFDIRKFEDNMATVVHEMPSFRHEFYAIAIKAEGSGKAISGHHVDFPEGSTIFFNSPFQIISWDIAPDWQGYYIMFTQDFIAQSRYFSALLDNFSFLKIDKAIPFEVQKEDVQTLLSLYHKIWEEYHSDRDDKFSFIESYVLLLLHHVKRYFTAQVDLEEANKQIRTADLRLLTRFQTLIQTSFYPNNSFSGSDSPHSPSFYAEKLNIHPNHLNAVVKNITGQTAISQIHNHILLLAKSYLVHTNMSIKEIAYTLHFELPNHFNTFFKKRAQTTPLSYRKQTNL